MYSALKTHSPIPISHSWRYNLNNIPRVAVLLQLCRTLFSVALGWGLHVQCILWYQPPSNSWRPKYCAVYLFYSKEKSTVVTARLKCVQCVLRSDGRLVTPDQCYDPTDPLLSRLLSGQNLFPSDKFCQPNIIENLKLLGECSLRLGL